MAPWQVLRASRGTRAGLGYRVRHGPGGLVHYSTAAAVALDSSRSFCLSGEKLTLQQLNRRLASYLQQVQSLEAANQRLEHQIQKELDRKCPRQLRELDQHLRTVSLLQDQISECLSAQAQVKLQLLSAELTIFDLNVRCEKECERRGCVEAELSHLRLLGEELQVNRLPELRSQLNDQTQQLMQLQIQHQQDMQGLLAQGSGGVAVEMQPAESTELIQQLDDLRQTGVMLLNKNQNECRINAQVSTLSSPEVTFDPPAGSEVVQAELEDLWRTAEGLEEELTQLQALNMVLGASSLEQTESFVQQLVVLQQRADGLCRDLDSVLQAVAQQARDHQALLDIKSRLETEIQDYWRLLDGRSPQGVSSLQSNSAVNVTSSCATTSPSAFRRNVTTNKTVSVQGGNLRMMEVQTVSRGHIRTVRPTPVVAPLSGAVTTVQSIRVHSKEKNSPVTSINTSNLTLSFHKSENQRPGALPERTGRESMTTSAMFNKQSRPAEDRIHAENRDLQNSSIFSTQISQCLEGAVVKASKPEINTAQGNTTLVPNTQSARSSAVQTKPETFTSKQTTTEGGLEAKKTGANIQTEITKTTEPEVKQGPHFVKHMTTTDLSKQTTAEVKKETGTVISAQINCTEGSIQAKNQDPAQVVSLSLEAPAEADGEAAEVAVAAPLVSGSHILRSEEAQVKVPGELTLMNDMDMERQEKKGEEEEVEVEDTLFVHKLDQSPALSDASNNEQNKVMEDADTELGIASALSCSPDSNENHESKTAQEITTLVSDTQSARSSAVLAKPETFTFKRTTTEAGLQTNTTGTNIQTEITTTIFCAEPEVKQGPHFVTHTTTTVPSKQTAAEVKNETETVISAQMNCTEGSIQAKNQDPAQVVSLSLEAPAEADGEAAEVTVAAPLVSGSYILRSEEAQVKVPGELTLMDDMDMERQEKKGEEVEVEDTLFVHRLDQSPALSDASNSEQNKVMEGADTELGIVTASSGSPDSNENHESKTAQEITTLIPDTQSARSSAVLAKPETFTFKQTTTEAGLQTNTTGTNIQTEITTTILCAEATTDPSKLTVAEVKKETGTVISAHCTDGSIQAKDQDPAQVVSLSLEAPAEAVGDAVEVATTAPIVSGSHILRCEEAQGKDSGELTLMDDKGIERLEKKGEEGVIEVEGTLQVELEMNKRKTVNSFLDTNVIKVDTPELDNEMVNLAGQEAMLSSTDSKKSISLTDSGVSLSSSGLEGLLSPREDHVFSIPMKPIAFLSPEICASPEETDVLMSMIDQELFQVDLEEHVRSPDLLLSPNDSDTCLSPVDTKVCLSLNGEEEDEEVCLSLTEADAHVKAVEKYILSTKEESQSLSFSEDQALPKENRNGRVSISVRDGDSLCFGSFEGNQGCRGTLNDANINSRPTSQGIGLQLSSSLGGLEFGGPGGRSIIANKEEQLGFGGLYRKRVRGASSARDRDKDTSGIEDIKDVQNPGGRHASEDREETSSMVSEVRRQTNCDWPVANMPGNRERVLLYGGSLVHTSTSLPSIGREETTSGATSQPKKGRFSSRGSGEWMVYSGSLGRKSSLDGGTSLPSKGKEGPSMATNPVTSPRETGRFGSRGSGEWMVYGGSLGRKSSLPNTESRESLSTAMQLATSPPGPGRFGSRGSGEWRVYGGSTGRLSSASSADRVSVSANYGQMISPPSSYTSIRPRHSSAGSGGRLSSGGVVIRSSSVGSGSGGRLSSSGSGGMISSSPGSHRTSSSGRFASTGSGEWKPVYCSGSARKSSVGSAGRSSGGGTTSSQRAPSPGGRKSVSGGSGGWLTSSTAGSNHISSPGSGSKLSRAESSDRISSRAGGRISSFSGSGRTNSTGGRIISSSDRPIRSTGSGAGGNKERISVCKMAALSISAAGRERSQDRRSQAQRSQQQQQQQAGDTSPLVQRWLITGVGVTSADHDGLDDIMRL